MTTAFYRGYLRNDGALSQRVRRLHIIRPDGQFPGRSAECGVAGWAGIQSTPVLIDPMPACPPAGLSWCPACIGHLAARLGLIDRMAGRLAMACRTSDADRADIAEDQHHVRLADGNEDHL